MLSAVGESGLSPEAAVYRSRRVLHGGTSPMAENAEKRIRIVFGVCICRHTVLGFR